MPTLHKESCPRCGQSTNERQITLFSGMVGALLTVYKYCRKHNRHFFSRKEIKHLFKNENETARFGDWVLFDPMVFRRDGRKGHYGLDMRRVESFFGGQLKIPSSVFKNPLTGEMKKENYVFIDEIKNLTEFLDQNRDFMARYRSQTQPLF